MKTLRILHITDLHFSTKTIAKTIGDVRDKSVSDYTVSQLAGANCKNIFLGVGLRSTLANIKVDVIACTGDLGTAGQDGTMELGVEYLLQLAQRLGVSPDKVIISPGNHDLDRKAGPGSELSDFIRLCREKGFVYAEEKKPVSIEVNNVPIIALNSCVGGTEVRETGLPADHWDKMQKLLKEIENDLSSPDVQKNIIDCLKPDTEALGLSAVGITQRELISTCLGSSRASCAVLLMHHSLYPTVNIQIRPYSSLIDSGPFLYELSHGGKHVFILHGHTHCEAHLSLKQNDIDGAGVISTIGSSGLHDERDASSTLVEITVTDSNELVKTDVYSIQRNASSFRKVYRYSKYGNNALSFSDINIILRAMKDSRFYAFNELAQAIKRTPDEKLATDLMVMEKEYIQISKTELPFNQWEICRKHEGRSI